MSKRLRVYAINGRCWEFNANSKCLAHDTYLRVTESGVDTMFVLSNVIRWGVEDIT